MTSTLIIFAELHCFIEQINLLKVITYILDGLTTRNKFAKFHICSDERTHPPQEPLHL